MPKSGGEHNYLLKSYGPYVAYVFDWTQSFLALPLGISYMAYMSALYLCSLFPSMSSLSHDKGKKK